MDTINSMAGKDPVTRRLFMELTAKLSLGVGFSVPFLPRQMKAEEGSRAKNLIYIYLSGGLSHIDSFDPKSKEVMGKTQVIDTVVDDMKMGHHLTGLAKLADRLAVINSMSSTNGDHAQAQYWMRTGFQKRGITVHPTIGPWAERILGKRNEILPDSVLIGKGTSNPGFFEPSLSPLPILDPVDGFPDIENLTTGAQFSRRMEMAQTLGRQFAGKFRYKGPESYVDYYRQANRLLQSQDLDIFDISNESNAEEYGTGRFGQGCLLARKLVENGVRVVEVISEGWDMHVKLDNDLSVKLPEIDQAIATLIKDLESRGLLDSTLIAIGTDFGRSPDFNRNQGRDHNPSAYSCVLAGGGIRGGTVYGETDRAGKKVKNQVVHPEDFIATIGYGLGLDLSKTVYSDSDRPFTFAGNGAPVQELFG